MSAQPCGCDPEAHSIGWICEQHQRLYAAAEILLQSAKDTMDYWESTGFADCEPDCDCIVDQMRDALAKAGAPRA